jgi:hypothetical protein
MKMGPVPSSMQRRTWDATNWRPYPKQEQVMLDRARFRLVAAGRRAGKSQIGGHLLHPEAFRALGQQRMLEDLSQRREFWIVGPEYSDGEKEFRVFYDGMKRLGFEFDKPGTYNNSEAGQMRVSCFDGRFIVDVKSAKYPTTLVGEGLSGVVFSEAAKLKPSVWTKFIRPTLADFLGWAYFGSTPEGKNWFYDLWMAGQDSDRPEWASWRFPSWENPYVYPGGADYGMLQLAMEARSKGKGQLALLIKTFEMVSTMLGISPKGIHAEIWSMLLDMSNELFNQEIAALFTEFVGRVFKDFDEEIHCVDDTEHYGWDNYYCADYGFTNPFAWLKIQIDPHRERVHVVDEYYERGRTTGEACREIRERGLATPALGFYPDPAEPDRTREIADTLHIRPLSPGSLEIKDRLEWIRRFLKPRNENLTRDHPEWRPKLTINRNRCPNTIREMNDYRYPETAEQASAKGRAAPENPQKKDDHTPEALGRFFSGYFGHPYTGGTRQSSAAVRRRRR